MVQLKSTDAQQITVKQKDIRILEKHAAESHKVPVFAIQFLNTGEVWLMCKQEDLVHAALEIGGMRERGLFPIPAPIPRERLKKYGEVKGEHPGWDDGFFVTGISPTSDVPEENGPNRPENVLDDNFPDEDGKTPKKAIKSSSGARKEFYEGFGRKNM